MRDPDATRLLYRVALVLLVVAAGAIVALSFDPARAKTDVSHENADRDFVALMVPHHQAAIEISQMQLRYGRNPQLRRLAQEIIVTQEAEIRALRLALDTAVAVRSNSVPSRRVR